LRFREVARVRELVFPIRGAIAKEVFSIGSGVI
jgi:hypothetical protein